MVAADLSPTGDRAVLLTYTAAYLYPRSPGEDWADTFGKKPTRLDIPTLQQGESIAWSRDGKALMFLIGTEMDYVEEKLQSGFVFNNPNEKGRCGCGESFHV